MKYAILGLLALGLASLAQPAVAQSSGCLAPATMAFPDFVSARADIVPSLHRQLSGIGRLAKANHCEIEVVCVAAAGANEDAKKVRNRQCTAASQAIARYETRSEVRSALVKAMTQTKTTAGQGRTVGTVYVILK